MTIGLCPGGACSVCQTVMFYVQLLLANGGNQEQVLDALETLCKFIPGETGQRTIECKKVPSLPNVDITIGGKVFTLTPEQVRKLLSSACNSND